MWKVEEGMRLEDEDGGKMEMLFCEELRRHVSKGNRIHCEAQKSWHEEGRIERMMMI